MMLPVLDHLVAAVHRAEQGSVIDFPLTWEVQQLYPDEARLGHRAVEIVDGAQYLLLEGRLGLLVDLLPPERHPVELRQVREIRMVGHHLHDVYG